MPLLRPQECSWSAFAEIEHGLLAQTSAAGTLEGFHYSSFLPSQQREQARASETGLACFVRTGAWVSVSTRACLLRDLVQERLSCFSQAIKYEEHSWGSL